MPPPNLQAAPLLQEELAAWLRLLETPGVGRLGARRLLSRFGSPQEVFRATEREWRLAVDGRLADALARPVPGLADRIARTERWLADDPRRALLTLGDAAYPTRLLELPDPPLLLYTEGALGWLHTPAIAIVGTRQPSPQGRDNARQFARTLAEAGWAVVSGLATGIDAAAHDGALAAPGGTVAIVGTGLDRVYPARHAALAARIAEAGLLVSEYPLGTAPLPANFPQRNRLIAGLGAGTLVVEAALQSGSLITARLAAEYGRDVFAVPGSIHNPQTRGCHALIKQGAKLVEHVDDILEELRPDQAAQRILTGSADTACAAAPDHPVLAALGHDPASIETLQQRTGLSPSDLTVALLDLELAGAVERLPGQIFQRAARP